MITLEITPYVTEINPQTASTEIVISQEVVTIEAGVAVPSITLANIDDDLAYATQATDGVRVNSVAAENLIFGDACYINSNGKWAKADATNEATARVLVMAAESISANATGKFLLLGFVRNDNWAWTVGQELYLSETAGELTQTPPVAPDSVTQVIGTATNTNRIYFNPSSDIIVHV